MRFPIVYKEPGTFGSVSNGIADVCIILFQAITPYDDNNISSQSSDLKIDELSGFLGRSRILTNRELKEKVLKKVEPVLDYHRSQTNRLNEVWDKTYKAVVYDWTSSEALNYFNLALDILKLIHLSSGELSSIIDVDADVIERWVEGILTDFNRNYDMTTNIQVDSIAIDFGVTSDIYRSYISKEKPGIFEYEDLLGDESEFLTSMKREIKKLGKPIVARKAIRKGIKQLWGTADKRSKITVSDDLDNIETSHHDAETRCKKNLMALRTLNDVIKSSTQLKLKKLFCDNQSEYLTDTHAARINKILLGCI